MQNIESPAFSPFETLLSSVFSTNFEAKNFAISENELLELLTETYHVIRLDQSNIDKHELVFLNQNFLEIAKKGSKSIGYASLEEDANNTEGASLRSKAIAKAITTGEWRILSPFTGKPEVISSSLGLEWYYHLFEGQICLASQMGSTMTAVNLETVWVFPQKRLIAYVENGLAKDNIVREVARLFRRCLNNAHAVSLYLNSNEYKSKRKVALTDFSCPHMSHNLWNIQTSWANIFDRCDTESIHNFILFSNQNFFGSLHELFPEKKLDCNKNYFCVKNDDDVFQESLKNNFLLYTVKDEFFTKDFSKRILNVARSKCSDVFLEEVRRLKQQTNPLVIITVRLDNRAWIEQKEGFPELFLKLREDFPDIGIIIDGLSSDTQKGWTTSWMSMENELRMANDIRTALPSDMPVVFGVGRTFSESLILIEAADLFIAPSGSGMGLYKWICNMPGIAFSNKAVLDTSSHLGWPLRVWHEKKYRHDIVPTIHLPHNVVHNGEEARNHETRANFHLDWKDIYSIAKPFIQKLQTTVVGESE